MTRLDELCNRLQRQYLEPSAAALPLNSIIEALRLALERINSSFGEKFEIEGLYGAVNDTLPADFEPALLIGAGAHLMRFLFQSHLGSYTNMPGEPALMQSLARYLEERFVWMLEGLRLDTLQESADLPFSRWEWKESLRWRN